MKKSPGTLLLIVYLLLCAISSCSLGEVVYPSAPTLLPDVEPRMRLPGFWISRIKDPDAIIMSAEEIGRYNEKLRSELGFISDIGSISESVSGAEIRRQLEDSIAGVAGMEFFFADGAKADNRFYERISRNMNTDKIPDAIETRFAFSVGYADVRQLPSELLVNEIPRELFLDRLQVSAIDTGTPLAVLHTSGDGMWHYVRAPLFSGWVPESTVGFSDRGEIAKRTGGGQFVVVTARKAELWEDEGRTKYIGHVRMAARLPLVEDRGAGVLVEIPVMGEGHSARFVSAFIEKAGVQIGYVPFTSRSVMDQAFKLLDAPYGWGDMYGEQDCSRLICEVFGVTGIELPRNSAKQALSGVVVYQFPRDMGEEKRKETVVSLGVPGIALLRVPGHIMLYLGQNGGVPYVIHSLWAYDVPCCPFETRLMANKTVVSTLDLGRGTKKGSLLSRLTSMVIIRNF